MTHFYFRFLCGALAVVSGFTLGVTGQYPLYAQAAAPERLPSFEVASVKENKTDPGRTQALVQPGGRFVATNAPLKLLIADAFLGAQRAKGPVEVVVIDSVERPTPD